MKIENIRRRGIAHDLRRTVAIAHDGKVCHPDCTECRLARKSLRQPLGGKTCRQACRPSRAYPLSRNSSAEKIVRRSSGKSRAAGVPCAQPQPCRFRSALRSLRLPAWCLINGRLVRERARPRWCLRTRERTSATLERGARVADEAGNAENPGSSSLRVAIPGTMPTRNAQSAWTASMTPAAARRWPNAHLKPVTGGGSGRTLEGLLRLLEASDCRVPFACPTIIPTCAGERLASSNAIWIASESATPSSRRANKPCGRKCCHRPGLRRARLHRGFALRLPSREPAHRRPRRTRFRPGGRRTNESYSPLASRSDGNTEWSEVRSRNRARPRRHDLLCPRAATPWLPRSPASR